MSKWDIPANINFALYENPLQRIIGEAVEARVKQEESAAMASITETIGYKIDKKELIKALNYDRNQYAKGYADCLKDHMTGVWRWNPDDGDMEPRADNRGAEAKDITEECYYEHFNTVRCPHCGCILQGYTVLENHYCYICGGQFGRKLFAEGEE